MMLRLNEFKSRALYVVMPVRKNQIPPAFKQYLKAQKTAEEKHGDKTIVMMQMGSFLEMFHIKFTDGTELGKADQLGDILNKMGEKNDQIGKDFGGKIIAGVSRYGFPYQAEAKARYVSIMNKRGYTVPVYYQRGNDKDPITKVVPRFLGDTWTPTIRPDANMTDSCTNEWFVGYTVKNAVADYINVSVCAINPYTCSFKTCEFLPVKKKSYGDCFIPESSDFLRINNPTEVIIWADDSTGTIPKLGISDDINTRVLKRVSSGESEGTRESVMNIIQGEYVLTSDIPDVVVRSFDFMMSTIPDVIRDTKYKLIHFDEKQTMILENHCLTQLNIIDTNVISNIKKRNRSVLGVINHTITPMGDRTLREWITHPSTIKSVIEYRTGLGKHLLDIETKTSDINTWENTLKNMTDLNRLFSAEVLGGLSYTLLMKCVDTVLRFIKKDEMTPLAYNGIRFPIPVSETREFLDEMSSSLLSPEDLPYSGSMVGGTSLNAYNDPCEIEFPFTSDMCEKDREREWDVLHSAHADYKNALMPLKRITDNVDFDLGYVNNTYVIWVNGGSKKRVSSTGEFWTNATKVDSRHKKSRYELSGETSVRVGEDYERLDRLIEIVNSKRNKIENLVCEIWISWSKRIRIKYEDLISRIAFLIGDVDASLSGVKCIRMYGYTYASVTDGESFYKVEGLRHPLIETIQQDTLYVPHTISLTPTKRGRLLYGVNSSGKSSLMKAIGISVILAQAGFPVPVVSLELGLYDSLFTRILGNDNLFRGMSTFAVESSELIRILKMGTDKSMVLGDELCSGTEQYGAEAIVAASILTLLKRNVSFVFATHWHRLRDLSQLASHPKLKWNHLRVDCDEMGSMIMHRTLEDGPGPMGYAIEYLNNMGADPEMIEQAGRIRDQITSEKFAIESARSWNGRDGTTQWNSRARTESICQICKKKSMSEIDHIYPRQNANADGGIAGIGSVHHGGNLVSLCKECHDKKTRGLIRYNGQTEIMGPNGIRSKVHEWEHVENTKITSDTKKDDDDIVKLIRRFSASGSSLKQIQNAMRRNGHKVSQSFIRDTLSGTE